MRKRILECYTITYEFLQGVQKNTFLYMRFFIVGLHGGWRAWRLNLTNYMASQSTTKKNTQEKISDNDSDDALFASQTSQSSSSSHPPPPKKKHIGS